MKTINIFKFCPLKHILLSLFIMTLLKDFRLLFTYFHKQICFVSARPDNHSCILHTTNVLIIKKLFKIELLFGHILFELKVFKNVMIGPRCYGNHLAVWKKNILSYSIFILMGSIGHRKFRFKRFSRNKLLPEIFMITLRFGKLINKNILSMWKRTSIYWKVTFLFYWIFRMDWKRVFSGE